MYISGISVQKRTPMRLTITSKKQSEERPYSSQYKLFDLQKQFSVAGRSKKQQQPEFKHKSQNKILQKQQDYLKQREKKEINKVKKVNTQDKKHDRNKNIDQNKSTTLKIDHVEAAKISAYFRYYPISILSVCGVKEEFMKILSQQLQFRPLTPFKKPPPKRQILNLWNKLNKVAHLKGKYKYRQRFNYAYSSQLKAIQYKRKEWKKKKESSSSESDDDDRRQKCRDMETWKKSMGVDGKVFIIKGKYPDLRAALLERGWVQNDDKKSNFFDLKWTTKISDINFDIIKNNQMVNHFNNNACLTSKYGICKSLRSIMCPEGIDIDKFFPKAYDLTDLGDFENFLQMFKWIFCESILKKYMMDEEISIDKVKMAIIIMERRLTDIENVISAAVGLKFCFCSINEWKFLRDKPCDSQKIKKKINKIFGDNLKGIVEDLLNRLHFHEPQFDLNGHKNIWIVKPAFLSRGRGIKCLRKLSQILDYSMGKQTQYVVQKYVENPLIINKRKFDIRVWVLIEDYNPPKIWFYNEFYVRFCLQDYDTSTLGNRYAHLTNNSVQKYNTKVGKVDVNMSMWNREKFKEYISEQFGEENYKTLIGKMKQIVIATILGTVDQVHGKRGSFQLIGYDMMIDDNLNPWLIEINSSPAMDYSSSVTRKLVKMVMQDIVKVVVDQRKKKNKKKTAGEFKCIYGGEPFESRFYRISLKQ